MIGARPLSRVGPGAGDAVAIGARDHPADQSGSLAEPEKPAFGQPGDVEPTGVGRFVTADRLEGLTDATERGPPHDLIAGCPFARERLIRSTHRFGWSDRRRPRMAR